MIIAGVISHAIAALAFLVLSVLLLTGWRGRLQGMVLVCAVIVSSLWAWSAVFYYTPVLQRFSSVMPWLEMLRDTGWCVFTMRLLWPRDYPWSDFPYRRQWSVFLFSALCAVIFGEIVYVWVVPVSGKSLAEGMLLGYLLFAVAGLVLVEQVFRNARKEKRWAVKYLCLGLGGIFAYDLFMYSDALLVRQVDADLWAARGMINALMVPLIAVSAARNPQWSLDIFVSRRVVFHTAALMGAGVYLLVMAGGGYYIRIYGGSWGKAAQAVFLSGAVIVLFVVLFSGRFQSSLKVFLNKHFFNYKYDYREEWLRFVDTLSMGESNTRLHERVIRAVGDIVDSPGGGLWLRREPAGFDLAARHNMPEVVDAYIAGDASIVRFLEERRWVVNLEEYRQAPGAYDRLELPDWLQGLERAWLMVPILHQERMMGFMLLMRPRAARMFNWEDSDLLKTVAHQSAAHLAQHEAAQALIEARQFEAFNRLSAFLVHDLKNLVAQLSLVAANAERHKHNPEFMEDAINTIRHSVGKMNRLMGQLRGHSSGGRDTVCVDACGLAREVIVAKSMKSPVPRLDCPEQEVMVMGDRDRLASVFGHVIQNAQDATPADGKIEIRMHVAADQVVMEVEDNGCGMDEKFIRERLFKPFDSTKGKTGMGIGAYQIRELVREMGGDIEVASREGAGTIFTIRLPLVKKGEAAMLRQGSIA